ncbi:hypothetical protein H310_14273 [Aphanomyces invadans]|uniref:Uncharacterized protein n=1 Tax=Aphanomyces invadans TaxID=157072 RepID=A0A024TAG9_9STRA|nr:hypothetical protein H310_14273 [Aphanomyces invadans]ETV91033.1 hypothetical protein H310_14273 [Aphanomyces invadans]|eukprot:XP_008880313.1 hypothetical protein H310_14273 [Aphanomyces invadans]
MFDMEVFVFTRASDRFWVVAAFRLFTYHRNLVYMFIPHGSNGNLAKYEADKRQRLALIMPTFPYSIECLLGDVNVWGDLLSCWGSTPSVTPVAHARNLLRVISLLQQAGFEWPTAASIMDAQPSSLDGGEAIPPGVAWSEEDTY